MFSLIILIDIKKQVTLGHVICVIWAIWPLEPQLPRHISSTSQMKPATKRNMEISQPKPFQGFWIPLGAAWVDWCHMFVHPKWCTETGRAACTCLDSDGHRWQYLLVIALGQCHNVQLNGGSVVEPVFLGNLLKIPRRSDDHQIVTVDMPTAVLITSLESPQVRQWAPAWSKEWQIPPLQRWRSRIEMAPLPLSLSITHEGTRQIKASSWYQPSWPLGSMVLLYMVTFTINIPQMLAYIPYMDPMGNIS